MSTNINVPPVNPGITTPGGVSQSTSTSGGVNQSTSTANPISAQLAQFAEQLAAQQYNWGQQQYADTSAMTNESVDNFLNASQNDMTMANQAANQYYQTTVPEIQQQASEAAQYGSAARTGINMGMAESQSQQGTNAALAAAKQNLQSYGINPSSGEYAELQNASKTAAGAAAAGAGTQAGLATEATGRQLLGQAIATGQQLPGQAINASQAGVAAQQGAENATLANANTGVALTDTGPASLISAAPNLSPNSQSSGQNVSQSQSTSQNIPQPPVVPSGTMQQAGANQLQQLGNYSGGSEGVSVSGPQSGQYARGGTIPGGFTFAAGGDATQGGYVPQSASPSGGVNVDDVPANLNAEEFVVPRDVARWKGEEFFHKMIDQSRKARMTAAQSVGPTAGPPQDPNQPPTFNSQSAAHGGSIDARHHLRDLQMDQFLNRQGI